MSVVVDDAMQRRIDELEAKGNFAQARELRETSAVSIDSLAFQTNVPSKFQGLVANSAAALSARLQSEERRGRDHDGLSRAFDMAASFQRQIDSNVVTLQIDGQELRISQGDLRKAMDDRLLALKERKKQLDQAGGNSEERKRLGTLIDEYEPVIKSLKDRKADAQTMSAVQDLLKKDPPLGAEIKRYQVGTQLLPTADSRASFSSEFFGDGIKAPSLTTAFAAAASPAPEPVQADPSIGLETRKQNLETGIQSLGL